MEEKNCTDKLQEELDKLMEYKKQLASLSEKEKVKRDLYLKQLADGTLQGPPTGYSTIDKQWLKYYNLGDAREISKKTVYQGLYDNNINFPNDLAIEYFGTKISFKKLFSNIEATAKALEVNGIKKGDFVTICAPGIPETVYTFYALSKIGAIANMIANYFEENDFINRIAECGSEILIVMDSFYDGIKEAVKKSKIKKVIIVPALNSTPLSIFSKKYKANKENGEIYWNDFIKEGDKLSESHTIPYEENLPLTMVYSSGTTGSSKGILLSNDSFQNSINAYFKSGLDITRGQKFYQIIPTWFSTGISTSIHLPLSCGASIYMDPRFERRIFAKNIVKAKPNYTVAPTSMYEGLLDEKLLRGKDISYFRNAFEGGEPLAKEVAERINNVFREHNNNSSIKVGYGQCECGATITTQTENTEHCNGSVGIPLPGINVQICNSNFIEVPTGVRGQIIVDTPSSMLKYYKNEEASEEYFFIDENGIKWNCTGDIGYMDSNGNLYVDGRASDFTIINGELIYNFDIEKIIKSFSEIKNCDVLSKKSENGDVEMAVHLIFEDDIIEREYENIIKRIQEKIYKITQNINIVPSIFKIRKDFPYAKSGKRDIQKIKNETEGFLHFDTQFLLENKSFTK